MKEIGDHSEIHMQDIQLLTMPNLISFAIVCSLVKAGADSECGDGAKETTIATSKWAPMVHCNLVWLQAFQAAPSEIGKEKAPLGSGRTVENTVGIPPLCGGSPKH